MIELNGYRDKFVLHFSAREQHHQQQQQQQQQKLVKSRLTVLKSSILLLKLASLVVNIKSQSSIFLCQIVRSVTALLSRSLQKATVSTPDKQEHQLAVHAVELVIPLLKHYVRQREGVASTVTLFQFLECVLDKEPNSTVQALLAQLLASGGMAVLVTMLDACPDASPLVCTTLLRLTAFQDQLSDQEVAANRSLFARMRGIPRLSCMLLPPFHPDDTAQIALAAKVYTKVPSELLPPDSYYLPSVEYMKDIVAEFPLSAHTPEAATLNSSAPSTHSFFNMTSISTTDFVVWPHLTPAAWKDIQTVALRAFVTLEWFGDTKVQARLDQRGKGPKSLVYQVYRQELIVLVHQPLVGHIMDPHLDMQQIARFGLGPTLRMLREAPICYAQIQQQLYELGRVLLERLRSDSTLVTHGTDVLEKKWDFARENAASLYVGMLAGDAINLRQVHLATDALLALLDSRLHSLAGPMLHRNPAAFWHANITRGAKKGCQARFTRVADHLPECERMRGTHVCCGNWGITCGAAA
ncbi:TPA: hypothetical protein ACH3X3_009180 [Trebouxia sp. C0006]